VDAPSAPPTAARPESDRLFDRALRVAGWAVALGVALELAHLAVLAFGDQTPAPVRMFAETLGKVTWSVLVCVSISCGLAAGNAWPRTMALLGLLSAPAGFAIARSEHKGVSAALSVAPGSAEPLSPFLLAVIKWIEFGVFGLVVARLTMRASVSLRAHLAAGAAIGLVVAAVVVSLHLRAQPDAGFGVLAGRAVAEILFPTGCAAVVCVSERAARLARGAR
jgi:hypothetical protein